MDRAAGRVTRRGFLKGAAAGAAALSAAAMVPGAGEMLGGAGQEEGGTMKILAINGSPRRGGSNTQRLLGPMLDAARQKGAEVEHLYLNDLDVRPCTGCFSCWTQTPGRCVQEDDMADLLGKLGAADAFVLGFGLYIFTAPAAVQAFLERLLPTVEPWLIREGDSTGHAAREGAHRAPWTVVCNCGFPEQSNFDALRAKFGHLGVQPVCMAAGEFLGHLTTAPELAEAWAGLKGALEEAGDELAGAGALSDEMRARLDRPVIEWAGVTAQEYNDTANQSFREALGRPGPPQT